MTHTLSRTEYGILVVLNTAIALVTGVTQFGLSSAFFRAYRCDYESAHDRLGVLSTVVVLLTSISLPITIAVILMAPWLAGLLFANPLLSGPVKLAALVVLMQNLSVPGFSLLRAENRAISYTFLSGINLLTSLVATIVLVGLLHMGINGALLALAGGYAFVAVSTLPVILLRLGFRKGLRPRIDIARNLLSFGLPLASSLVSVWVLQLSDRYLLSRLDSVTQTASYAVAYSLGGILAAILLGPFSLAWPTAMYDIAKRKDAAEIFRLVFRWYFIVLLFTSFGLSFVAIAILNAFFPPAYHAAAPVIPVISAAVMFYGLYSVLSVGISIRRKTWLAFTAITASAIINVVLNVFFIPLYGSMGAALSTLLAYIVLSLTVYIINQLIYPVPFEIGRFSIALVFGTALYVESTFLSQSRGLSYLGV